ncbi:hypothetical protein DPMN_096961 [Dreissena polymorpha]|uniref:Uncharacterized protein n=1 Tax=Dreissena polymorpha TaxID=45954 RepID=A0A9D4LAV7_DREPO|nr:hypothetical protein DPMN_096961 [Dreissena polymorpha]
MKLSFTPDTTIQQALSTTSGFGQLLIHENTVTRESKPEACCPVRSQNDHEDKTSDTNKQGLVSSPVSRTARQAEKGNQTSVLNKPDQIDNQISVTSRHGDIAQQKTAVNKPDNVSNPISYSSTQPNITSDVNKPGQMSDTGTSSSRQLVHGYQPSGISKSDSNHQTH